MKTTLLSLLLVFWFIPAFPQLSGTYTVGGVNPDFQTFEQALYEVWGYGLAGPVTFNLRNGSYYGFSLNTISYNPGNDTLTIQSESLDPYSVIIDGYVTLNQTDHLRFNCITFLADAGQTKSEITINECDHLLFSKCRIISPIPSSFSGQEALVKISYPSSGSVKYVNFTESTLFSDTQTLLFIRDKGNSYFVNDSISGDLWGWGNMARKTYQHCVFMLGNAAFQITNQYFYSCAIFSNQAQLRIQGNFYYTDFHCRVMPYANVYYYNHFFKEIYCNATTNLTFVGNTCDTLFETDYCTNAVIANNKLYGECWFNSDNQSVYDNFFFGHVIVLYGPGQVFKQNNFSRESIFETNYAGGIIENNNIANLVMWLDSFTLSNNNFFDTENTTVSTYGTNPFFYEPQYVSAIDLHAQNPALIGKSTKRTNNYFPYDIDSVYRDRYATIGANEICLDFSSDTILLKCNDSICLAACIFDSTVNYWSPTYMFTDSTSSRPTVQVGGPVRFYLNNRNSGVTDSVYITVSPGIPVAHASYTRNNYTVLFHNSSACADSYLWDFGDTTTSTEINPLHTYSNYGQFLCRLIATSSMGQDTADLVVEIPNGVEDYEMNGMKICPNPAKDLVVIDLENLTGSYEVEIYNETGIKMMSLPTAKSRTTINLSSLPRGIYLVRAVSTNYNVCKKLILE